MNIILFLFVITTILSTNVRADYLCTYAGMYLLQDDGTIKGGDHYQKGERFTVTINGETGGAIHGSYEVFHDGKQPGYAWHGMREDNDMLQYSDPEEYKQKVFISKVERRRQIPERLWIEEFAEGEKKPFLLSQNGFMSTGLCEKL